jgi:hypothetical protein
MDESTSIAARPTSLTSGAPVSVFLIAGLIFLLAALALLLLSGYMFYYVGQRAPLLLGGVEELIGGLLVVFLAPLFTMVSGVVCALVGTRLLKAAGVATQRVIPAHDYELLSAAIRDGNEKAVSEYIRLSSLRGITGTFTRVGLTGLPLATILLTVFLAVLGLSDQKFFDLAQLTLGAFIGSYVQKRQEPTVT